MIPLKLKLLRIENVVIMKVLEQDESTRSGRRCQTIWKDECEGMYIYSSDRPRLTNMQAIEVRGFRNAEDLVCDCCCLPSTRVAKEYIERIKRTVANYNASLRQEEAEQIEREDVEIHIAE